MRAGTLASGSLQAAEFLTWPADSRQREHKVSAGEISSHQAPGGLCPGILP